MLPEKKLLNFHAEFAAANRFVHINKLTEKSPMLGRKTVLKTGVWQT